MRKLLLAALTAAAFTLPAAAGPLEDGGRAYQRGDYAGAMNAWRPISSTDPTVMNNIGVMYMNGHGVPRNYQLAVQWLSRSAAAGSSLGQNSLGGLYRDGRGVKQDYGRAMTFFAASAAQGNPAGQINLGRMYLLGQGTRPDPVHAYMWFDLAAAQGFGPASNNRAIAQSRLSARQVADAHALAQRCRASNYKNCA
jgi:TPR repeat protein